MQFFILTFHRKYTIVLSSPGYKKKSGYFKYVCVSIVTQKVFHLAANRMRLRFERLVVIVHCSALLPSV